MLDVRFHLTVRRPEWLDLLDTLYAAPEFAPIATGPEVRHEFRFGIDERAGGSPAGRPEPGLLVAEWAFRALLSHSESFHLVHAGAVAHGDEGILVVGPPFAGKTTLTLALVEAGLHYFSDDVGAIARSDGRLHPFRRRAGVRLPAGGRRYLFPGTDDGRPTPEPSPLRLGWLFILEAPRAPSSGSPGDWTLILDAAMVAEAIRLKGREEVRVVGESPWGGGLRLDFAPTTGSLLAAAVTDILGKEGEGILYLGPTPRTWETGTPPAPRLTEIPTAEAAGEVMRHLLNRAGDVDLAVRFGRHPHLRILSEVLGWLAGVRACRVVAGAPAATAEAIKSLVAGAR
ncbi:MAG TPA: hypothetical protein VJV75_12940 [Candidatus Polarisedimenticolia bacterium]|nr:hypothetical protein [Candidatus Polarisedimenticolia bacterium]